MELQLLPDDPLERPSRHRVPLREVRARVVDLAAGEVDPPGGEACHDLDQHRFQLCLDDKRMRGTRSGHDGDRGEAFELVAFELVEKGLEEPGVAGLVGGLATTSAWAPSTMALSCLTLVLPHSSNCPPRSAAG